MAKESLIRCIRVLVVLLSMYFSAPILFAMAAWWYFLVVYSIFGLNDIPAAWETVFEVAIVLLLAGIAVATALIGWCVWKLRAWANHSPSSPIRAGFHTDVRPARRI